MFRRRLAIARLLVATSVALLVLAAITVPVAAGSTVRYVDDDSVSGDGPSGCDTAAYSSIQDAIDDASPRDEIAVCPGTYVEQLRIETPKLFIHTVGTPSARIVAPEALEGESGTAELTVLVHIVDANRTRFADFEIRVPTALPCETVNGAIVVEESSNVVIKSNRIRPIGGSFDCGLDYGIVLTPSAEAMTADIPLPPGEATARILFNTVRDFRVAGITVGGDDTAALVYRNTLRYWHEGSGGLDAAGADTGPAGIFVETTGVAVFGDVLALVKQNHIESGPGACPACPLLAGGATTPVLGHGIWRLESDRDARFIDNFIRRARNGITSEESTGGRLVSNEVTRSGGGIDLMETDDSLVRGNHVHDGAGGIRLDDASEGNLVEGNVAEDHEFIDCLDESSGTGTADTANTWVDNIGLNDHPEGICLDP